MRTYGHLAVEGADYVLSGLDPHAIMQLKRLFPKVPKGQGGPFRFKATLEQAADLTWFFQRYPPSMTADVQARLNDGLDGYRARQALADHILNGDCAPPLYTDWRPGFGARPHQVTTIELLRMFGGVLCGDDTGLGKTFVGMGAAMLPGALPAIVVCDRHLQDQWREKVEQTTTLSAHCVTQTTPYEIPPCDVRIFGWTQILGWADAFALMGVGLVAFDEMQELRNGTNTQKGMAALQLVSQARYRLGLTATPIYNYGVEIYNIMGYLRADLLGSFGDFAREWAPSGHITNPSALGAYMREQHAFTRHRKPGDRVNRIVQLVDHDAASLASIDDVARQLAETAATGSFVQRGEAMRQLDLRVRQQTGIAKAQYVADVVRLIVEGGEAVILAGWHREVYRIWMERLADLAPAMFTGSETKAEKARQKARFLAGETDVFILSLRSGRGVDGLQARCKFVVVGELDWSPQVHHQVIGRVDREGSIVDDTEDEITALYLVADDGSDPPMMEVNGLKASEAKGIVDPFDGAGEIKTDESRFRALVDRYLQKREVAA